MKILVIIGLLLFKLILKFRLWPLGVYAILMTTTLREWEQSNPTIALVGFGAVAVLIAISWGITVVKKVGVLK